jgi:Cu/Ag efflux protein CusF
MNKNFPIALTLATCLLVGIAGAWAKTAKNEAVKVAPIKTITQQGTVKAVDVKADKLTIDWKTKGKLLFWRTTRSHKLSVALHSNTQLTYQDMPVQLSELKAGSEVEIAAQKDQKLWVASRITVLKMKAEAAAPLEK